MHTTKKKSVKRDSNLLSESIAEAQTLVTVATENAKMQLEEAFTPHLQSILAQRIQNEVEGSDEEDEFGDITEPEEDESTDDLEGGDDLEGDDEDFEDDDTEGEDDFEGGDEDFEDDDEDFGDDEDLEGDEEDTEGGEEFDDDEDIDFDDEDLESEPEEDASEPTEDDLEMEPEEGDEEDKDIQEIINEIESGLDAEEDGFAGFDDEPGDEDLEEVPELDDLEDEDVYEETEMGDYDEEIDIESILREVEMEGDEEDDLGDESLNSLRTENAVLSKKVKTLTKDLNEHIKVLKYTKAKLNEVNLLNSKLFFTNKLFKKNNLTNNEKMKIIESFDRARSLNEVKLLYTTLAVTYKAAKAQNISESKKLTSAKKITSKIAGGASKPMRSTKPSRQITEEIETNNSADVLYESLVIVDNDESKRRLQSLANIGKKKRKSTQLIGEK